MKKIFFVLFLLLYGSAAFSQRLYVDYSNSFKISRQVGTLNSVIGENSKYVYVKFILARGDERYQALERANLTTVGGEYTVIRKEMKKKGLTLSEVICNEKNVLMVWVKSAPGLKRNDEYWVEILDSELTPKGEMQKVFEDNAESGENRGQVLFRPCFETGKLMIGLERIIKKSESVEFEYKLFGSEMQEITASTVTLPLVAQKNVREADSEATLEEDDNIYVTSKVTMTREEKKDKKRGKTESIPCFPALIRTRMLYPRYPSSSGTKTFSVFITW